MGSSGAKRDESQLAFWLTRRAYEWERGATSLINEFRYAEAAIHVHEAIEFTVKALCRHLHVAIAKEHVPPVESLLALSDRVGRLWPESKLAVIRSAPVFLGYTETLRNVARYGLEGRDASSVSPELAFSRDYCAAGLSALSPLSTILTRVQLGARWGTPNVAIGVLDAKIDDSSKPCPKRWSEKCPSSAAAWSGILGTTYGVESVRVAEIDERYAALIDPFGETYPETDVVARPCFERILSYIENGGLLVTSAGLPFYAAWDNKEGKDTEVTDTLAFLLAGPEPQAQTGGTMLAQKLTVIAGTIPAREFGVVPTISDGGFTEPMSLVLDRASDAPAALKLPPGLPKPLEIFRPTRWMPPGAIPILHGVRPGVGEVYPLLLVPKSRGWVLISGLNLSDIATADYFCEMVKAILEWQRSEHGILLPTS